MHERELSWRDYPRSSVRSISSPLSLSQNARKSLTRRVAGVPDAHLVHSHAASFFLWHRSKCLANARASVILSKHEHEQAKSLLPPRWRNSCVFQARAPSVPNSGLFTRVGRPLGGDGPEAK